MKRDVSSLDTPNSPLVGRGPSCLLQASISWRNFCCNCCCLNFLRCLGSEEPATLEMSAADLHMQDQRNDSEIKGWRSWTCDCKAACSYLDKLSGMFSISCWFLLLHSEVLVLTEPWIVEAAVHAVVACPTAPCLVLLCLFSRARLQYLAFSTRGSLSTRFVWAGSSGGGGYNHYNGNSLTPNAHHHHQKKVCQ